MVNLLLTVRQSRPDKASNNRITKSNVSPPLGKYPQPRLYGHDGKAPRANNNRTMMSTVIMAFPPFASSLECKRLAMPPWGELGRARHETLHIERAAEQRHDSDGAVQN